MTMHISIDSAKSDAIGLGFMPKTADRLDAYPDAIYLIGNNLHPGYKWTRPGLVCEKISSTTARGSRWCSRTMHIVREASDEEFEKQIDHLCANLQDSRGWAKITHKYYDAISEGKRRNINISNLITEMTIAKLGESK